MPLLQAKFTLDVSSPCLLDFVGEPLPIRLSPNVRGFSVEVTLIPAEHWRGKLRNDDYWTTTLEQMVLLVSRDEPTDPPIIDNLPDGTKDLTQLGAYLRDRLPEYKLAAHELSNNILRYFRDHLFTPSTKSFPMWTQALSSPIWFNAEGKELRGCYVSVVQPVPGMRGELGTRRLRPNDLSNLEAFISSPTDTPLDRTLLSDAQTAWFEGSLRRCVLELAICIEVLVKRKFFAAETPSGAAFDYLEDKAKVSVRTLELIDAVALESFQRSYRQDAKDQYTHIDHLFRCRNKIMHRGALIFKTDANVIVDVDAKIVECWWHAVVHLREWISKL